MQLLDAGQQLATRPAANPLLSPGWANNAPASSPPTIADPDTINAIMAELMQFLTMTGQTASKTNTNQVASAAAMLFGVFGYDTGGTADEYVITPPVPLPALLDGQIVRFWTTRESSGSPTLQIGALAAQPIVFPSVGGARPPAYIIAGGLNEVIWDAGFSQFLTFSPQTDRAANGYYKSPNGVFTQWGSGVITAGNLLVGFPLTFTNAAVSVVLNDNDASGWSSTNYTVYGASGLTPAGFTAYGTTWNGSTFVAATTGHFNYLAIGY